MKICGIYLILNKVNGFVYVGSSLNIKSRFGHHRCELARGDHHNYKIQRDYIRMGRDAFEYKIIALCQPEERFSKEKMILGYFSDSAPGVYNERDPEMKTITQRAKDLCRAAMLGEKHPNSKITDAQSKMIHERANKGESVSFLAKEFGVSFTTIWNIKKGIRGSWDKRCANGIAPISAEERSRIGREVMATHHKNPEMIEKMKKARLSNIGIKRTPEQKKTLSIALRSAGISRLTNDDIAEIISLRSRGVPLKDVCKKFHGMSQGYISMIANGKIKPGILGIEK